MDFRPSRMFVVAKQVKTFIREFFDHNSLSQIGLITVKLSHTIFTLQGRTADAEVEFEKLLGGLHVKFAMAELLKSDRADETDTITFSDLIYGRHSRVVFIGSILFALQPLSGINAVFYFSSTIFRSAGVSSNLVNAFIGIANLVGFVIALILMDKLGRKGLLLWSFFGMVVSTCLQVAAAGLFASTTPAQYLSVGGMLT